MTNNQNRVMPLAKLEEDCNYHEEVEGFELVCINGKVSMDGQVHFPHELCQGTGKLPLIRTSKGRMLRRECPNAKPQDETPYARFMVCINGQYKFANGIGACPTCKGRGWLPVGEDEALVVCLEWMIEQGYRTTISPLAYKLLPPNAEKWTEATIHDHDIVGAVFEAVAQVAKGSAVA